MTRMVEMSEKAIVDRFEYSISQAKLEQSFVCERIAREDLEFALDLINRKNAENERLKKIINTSAIILPARQCGKTFFIKTTIEKITESARTEAIKEFSEAAVACSIQFYFDQIREFIREKTKLDPVFDFNPTTEELNQYANILRDLHHNIAKEMGVEL